MSGKALLEQLKDIPEYPINTQGLDKAQVQILINIAAKIC
jgi:hypothetical protein